MPTTAGWMQRSQTTVPTARHRHAMAPLYGNSTVLMIGGLSASTSGTLADDWIYDPSANTWTAISGTSPAGRFGHGLGVLASTGNVLMFGGSTSGFTSLLGDTWLYDPSSGWSQLGPATAPIARYLHAMTGALGRGVVVLFGGYGGNSYRNDTWEFDGTEWTNRTPASGSPGVRYAACMAYDPDRNIVVMFGGWNGSTLLNDTWEWNGTSWLQRAPTAVPPARDLCSMAYDSSRGVMVMFSGSHGLADEWTWNGTNWTQVNNGIAPPERRGPAMVDDPATGGLFLFGGLSVGGTSPRNDTWTR
jgi:hypothetical protein